MKKVTFAIVLALVSICSFAQEKQITGFGILKLGMSISDAATKIENLSGPKVINNKDEYVENFVFTNTSEKSFYLYYDESQKDKSQRVGSADKRVIVFQVGSIQITNRIVLKNVILSFFNDSLYKIEILGNTLKNDNQLFDEYQPRVYDMITTKYGKHTAGKRNVNNKFTNMYHNTSCKTNLTAEKEWQTNVADYYCAQVNSAYINFGDYKYFSVITLYNNRIATEVTNTLEAIKNKEMQASGIVKSTEVEEQFNLDEF